MGLLRHFSGHGTPLTMDEAMTLERLRSALQYGCHSSALLDAALVRAELRSQTAMGHIVVLPWVDIRDLPGL